ncbi:AbrB/MazE/SpoVT family DNA-binding domain-containing protein [Candidatus Woesearchaeota archaeon]|nr:AbrB/MazE/SpoVT family DNA-binding domain-containing protein [Candidatus Woesearchaeota archaeon]
MTVKTVKVSEKGQIAIPLDIREAMGLKKGDELVLIQQGDKVLMEKGATVSGMLRDEFTGMLKLSEKTAKELWDNEFDEVWNNV